MGRAFWVPCVVALMCLCITARSDDVGHWIPDSTTVASIERYSKTHMPVRNESDKAGPIGSYARYYTGITLNGRKTVFGEYVSAELREAAYPVGVHIVSWDKMPGITDGGCYLIDLWFDVRSGRVIAITCHGIA